MGRTKKKPKYDQKRIMEQFQNCVVEAYTLGMAEGSGISLRQVSDEFGITLMKMNITVRQSRQSGVARATCPD